MEQNAWVDDYALFMAIKDSQSGKSWQEWPEALRNRDPEAIANAAETYHDDVLFYAVSAKDFL